MCFFHIWAFKRHHSLQIGSMNWFSIFCCFFQYSSFQAINFDISITITTHSNMNFIYLKVSSIYSSSAWRTTFRIYKLDACLSGSSLWFIHCQDFFGFYNFELLFFNFPFLVTMSFQRFNISLDNLHSIV